MIKRYNNISLALGVPGLVLQVVGNIISQPGPNGGAPGNPIGIPILLLGTVLLIAGFSYYAKSRGRSGWWGLCGFLSCIGLVILALLKDEAPNG